MDLMSPNLIDETKKLGFYSEDKGDFDFQAILCARAQAFETAEKHTHRYRHGKEVLDNTVKKGSVVNHSFT